MPMILCIGIYQIPIPTLLCVAAVRVYNNLIDFKPRNMIRNNTIVD